MSSSLIGQLAKGVLLIRCPGKPGYSNAYFLFLAFACHKDNFRARVSLGLDPFGSKFIFFIKKRNEAHCHLPFPPLLDTFNIFPAYLIVTYRSSEWGQSSVMSASVIDSMKTPFMVSVQKSIFLP
ncbi:MULTISPECIES: hypothetical protein [unclassified Pseudomonas]|uniref:hypothetical protein n=1 Tax=unclassified Pseudomonas TaxID=196821 RepID=UPI002AC92084|nr:MULTISPECIES: hypothetical protein [unclassified Pseudomonas]MEB0041497.1 hypothetical protein [Pseudomonas sp. MH10]MEB0121894.1 hypothetical protein [Pseudomonas sp. CCI1.2]MEB0159180.1 hypothetical protein [Pseudomonas sp. AH2 (2023)]WPX52324.1 hypothetical protein RHM65_15940 [Pseudomonas sp. CCI4.2]